MNLYDRYYPHAESLKHKFEETAKGLQAELDSIQEVDDWFPAAWDWADGRLLRGYKASEFSEDTRTIEQDQGN